MKDHEVLKRIEEMCIESLSPEAFASWAELAVALIDNRKSLVHHFVPGKENDRFCEECGRYLTSDIHTRG